MSQHQKTMTGTGKKKSLHHHDVAGGYEQEHAAPSHHERGDGGLHGGGGDGDEREAKRAKLMPPPPSSSSSPSASPPTSSRDADVVASSAASDTRLLRRPSPRVSSARRVAHPPSSGGIRDGTAPADGGRLGGGNSSSTAVGSAGPVVSHRPRNEAPEVDVGESAPSTPAERQRQQWRRRWQQEQNPDEPTSHSLSLLPLSMRMMAPLAPFAYCGCGAASIAEATNAAAGGYYCSYDPAAAAGGFGGGRDGMQRLSHGTAEEQNMNGNGGKRSGALQSARRAEGSSVEGPRQLSSLHQRRYDDTDQNGRGDFRETDNGSLRYPPKPLSPHRRPRESTTESLFRAYIASCNLYSCQPNPGILTALRFGLPTLRVSANFHDADALALSELLLHHCNASLRHVTRLDFSVATRRFGGKLYGRLGFGSHGAFALSKVLQRSRYVREVFLQRNKIGPYGASAIFRAVGDNPNSVECLVLRRCRVGERGALAFARYVVPSEVCRLREVDLSNNRIGFRGSTVLCDALHERERRRGGGAATIEVDLQGNLVFQEIMNCLTHGLGIILCIIGTILLTRRVRHRPTWAVAACAIYSASLLVLYTSSTLFHSFFTLRTTRYIFGILDHCSIYILIAGSYTPILGISLRHEPKWSVYLVAFVWACCFCGVYVEAFCTGWRYKGRFSLAMYLGMGWACMICLPDLMAVLPQGAVNLLVLGGVAYTVGVPFFVRDNNLDHSIWHLFVLSASIFHWFSVFSYVALLAGDDEEVTDAASSHELRCANLRS